jgi:hypothetical protein
MGPTSLAQIIFDLRFLYGAQCHGESGANYRTKASRSLFPDCRPTILS